MTDQPYIQQSEIEGGAHLDRLAPGKTLAIRTRNRTYLLAKTETGYTIVGHPKFCPEPTVCSPHGSTWGGSMLKPHFVGRGMFFEFQLEAWGTVLTSEVQDVEELS